MIADLLMLTCGWVAGVVTTLAIRQALDDERRPLDPTLLPTAVPVPIASLPALPPQLSPYAPKNPRAAQLRTHEKHKLATRQKSMDNPLVQHAKYIIRDNRVCL